MATATTTTTKTPYLLLAAFSFIILFTAAAAATTATLDVSASIAAAARAVDPQHFVEQVENEIGIPVAGAGGAASPLRLKLHSRDFLPADYTALAGGGGGRKKGNYQALTADRLARDEARVKGILSRVSLAANGVSRADLLPSESVLETAAVAGYGDAGGGFQGPIVSGTSQGSGEYFSRLGIGNPARELFMVVDTGSDVSWIQCEPCSDCYRQTDPVFDPSSSSSYSPLACDSQRCRSLDVSACRQSICLYQVSYGDGSYTVGDFATETFTFGAGEGGSSVAGVAVGCGHDNEGLFVGAAGLLGLGGGSLSFPSQVSVRSFSYCLVDRDSQSASDLEFGGAAAADPGAVTAPLLRNNKLGTFYYVGVVGISVGGRLLTIPPSAFSVDGSGGVILDSGTAVTRLQSDAYAALRGAFSNATAHLPRAADVALFDTCYDLSSRSSVEVPTVAFHFPGGEGLSLPAKNYLIPVDSAGTFCLAFAPTSSPLSIIGNVQQQGTRVAFDLDNSVVVFTPNKC